MDLSKISAESLRVVCEFLLSQGTLTEQQFFTIIADNPTNELKRTVDLLHSCLCTEEHDHTCDYFKEEQRTDCWILPKHKEWLTLTSEVLSSFDVSESNLRIAIKEAITVVQSWQRLTEAGRYIFKKMIAM